MFKSQLSLTVNPEARDHDICELELAKWVWQGSVVSPLLINMYVNDLLESLQIPGVGAQINGKYTGCNMYVDDIALLSPRRAGLQCLLDTYDK